MAKRCSEFNAIREFIKMIFDIFNGTYGKLTVNSHKISLLQVMYVLVFIRKKKVIKFQRVLAIFFYFKIKRIDPFLKKISQIFAECVLFV